MDCGELCAPATLYLPVFVERAMFLASDAQAVQGDGEVSDCRDGMRPEVDAAVLHLPRPEAGRAVHGQPGACIFPAFASPHYQAAALATRQALRHLEQERGLSPDDAYVLAGFILALRITQLVDPLVGVHAVLRKGIFTG